MTAVDDYQQYQPWSTIANAAPQHELTQPTGPTFSVTQTGSFEHDVATGNVSPSTSSKATAGSRALPNASHFSTPTHVTQPVTPHHHNQHHNRDHTGIPPLHTNLNLNVTRASGGTQASSGAHSPSALSSATSATAALSHAHSFDTIISTPSSTSSGATSLVTPLSSRPTSSSEMGIITMDSSSSTYASYSFPFGSSAVAGYPPIHPGVHAQVPSSKFNFECSVNGVSQEHQAPGGYESYKNSYDNSYEQQQQVQQSYTQYTNNGSGDVRFQQYHQQQQPQQRQEAQSQSQQPQQQQHQLRPNMTSTMPSPTPSAPSAPSSSLPRLRLSPHRTPVVHPPAASASTGIPSETSASATPKQTQYHPHQLSQSQSANEHVFHQQPQNRGIPYPQTQAQSRSPPRAAHSQSPPDPQHQQPSSQQLPSQTTHTHGQPQAQTQVQGQTQTQKQPFLSLSTIARQIASNAAAQKKNLAPRGGAAATNTNENRSTSGGPTSSLGPVSGGERPRAAQTQTGGQRNQSQGQGQGGDDERQFQQQQGRRNANALMGEQMQTQDQPQNNLSLTPAEARRRLQQDLQDAGYLYTPHSGSGANGGAGAGSDQAVGKEAHPNQQFEYDYAYPYHNPAAQIPQAVGGGGSLSGAQAQPSSSSPSQWTMPTGLTGGLSPLSGIASETGMGMATRRPGGACTRCKKMKMKCTFPSPTAPTCLRCLTSNVMQPCTVEGRKPRTPSAKEALLAQLREKDATIARILSQWVAEREDLGGGWNVPGGGGAQIVLAGGKVVAAMENNLRDKDGLGQGNAAATIPTTGKKALTVDFAKSGSMPPSRASTFPSLPSSSSGVGAGSFSLLGPTERAALMSAEKGGLVGSGTSTVGSMGGLVGGLNKKGLGLGLGLGMGMKKENKDKDKENKDRGAGDDSDEEWSSDEDTAGEGDDAWDEEVERRWGEVDPAAAASPSTPTPGPGASMASPSGGSTISLPIKPLPHSGHLQLVSLPSRISPMGVIARLSLEDGGVRGIGSTTGSVFGKSVLGGLIDSVGGSMKREESTTPTPTPVTPRATHSRTNSMLSSAPSTSSSLRKRLFPPEDNDGSDADADASDGDDISAFIEEGEELCGIASPEYFHPGPASNLALRRVLNSRAAPPPILATGLINWEEVEELFEIFFTKVSVFVSVLDETLHTPQSVYERDPFLFTVVCAISSRYLASRPKLHPIAMHFAKSAAANALISGTKSIEMAQAYLLLSVHGLPARRWEEDRSWFYGGLAGRIATDLALNRTSSSMDESNNSVFLGERHAREKLNRIRTWLNCWNVDRSSSTQFGKPTGLEEDEVVGRATEVAGGKGWWKSSQFNHRFDVHIVWYTELLRVMSRFHERVKEKARNIRAITEMTEQELRLWHDRVRDAYERDSDPADDACVFRARGYSLFENYMRLAMYSFGFEEAWKRRGKLDQEDLFFAKCLQCATSVVKQLCDDYAGSGYLKYAPDCYFVMGGFSGAFLLKMLRPQFSVLLDSTIRERIITQIRSFIKVLTSKDAAINDTHTPMLYAKFLHTQLKHVLQPQEKVAPQSSEECQNQQVCKQEDNESQVLQGMDSTAGSSGGATPRNRQSALPQPAEDRNTPTPAAYAQTAQNSVQHDAPQIQSTGQANLDSFDWSAAFMNTYTPSTTFNDYSSNGSGSHTAGSTGMENLFSTEGPGQQNQSMNDSMEICEDELLSSMQAVSSEQWLSSVLMPGFRWPSPTSGGSMGMNMAGVVGGAGLMDVEIVGSPTGIPEQPSFSPVQQQFQHFPQQQQFQQSPGEQQFQQEVSEHQQQYQMNMSGWQ